MNESFVKTHKLSSPDARWGFWLALLGITLASIAFACSLVYPAAHVDGKDRGVPGLFCFLFAWSLHLSWWANPFLLLAAWCLWRQWSTLATVCATVAILLSLTAFQAKEIWIDEAGHTAPITELGLSFYLWLSSGIALLLTAALIMLVNPRSMAVCARTPEESYARRLGG